MFENAINNPPPVLTKIDEAPPTLPAGHPALKLGDELVQLHSRFDSMLSRLESQKGDYSADYLKREKTAISDRRQAEVDSRLAQFLGQPVAGGGLAGGSIEVQMIELENKLGQATEAAHLADKLDPARVSLARQQVESLAAIAGNLAEFEGAYAQSKDPHVKRAFEMFGGAIAAQRWQGVPAVGGFIKNLQRSYDANFQTDQTRSIQAKLNELTTAVWQIERLTTQQRARNEGLSTFLGGSSPYQARAQQLLERLGAFDFATGG